MNQLSETIQHAAQNARDALKDDKRAALGTARVLRQLAKQDQRLDTLEDQVKDLQRTHRRGGGFPWTLLLLAGGIYALLRARPDLLDRIKGLLGQADPGIQGNLHRAGAAASDAVQASLHGDDPSGAAKAAAGELGRAGEKVVDAAQDKAKEINDQLKD